MKTVFVFLCLLAVALSEPMRCGYTYTNGNRKVEFDLSKLVNEAGYYTYRDILSDGSRNRTFLFNICQNFEKAPTPNCVETQHDAETKTTAPSPMYVIDHHDNDRCSRGGGDLEDSMNYGWIILDYDNPAAGITLQYKNGDYCPESIWSNYRTIYMSFECRETNKRLEETFIYESYGLTCYDRFWISTPNACPTTCPHTDTTICSSHGICLYDDVTQTARCMCNSGYTGDDCGSRAFIGLSASDCFYIANSIALLAVICTIGYMWNKIRKLRVDPDADVSLEAQFNQLAQYTK